MSDEGIAADPDESMNEWWWVDWTSPAARADARSRGSRSFNLCLLEESWWRLAGWNKEAKHITWTHPEGKQTLKVSPAGRWGDTEHSSPPLQSVLTLRVWAQRLQMFNHPAYKWTFNFHIAWARSYFLILCVPTSTDSVMSNSSRKSLQPVGHVVSKWGPLIGCGRHQAQCIVVGVGKVHFTRSFQLQCGCIDMQRRFTDVFTSLLSLWSR